MIAVHDKRTNGAGAESPRAGGLSERLYVCLRFTKANRIAMIKPHSVLSMQKISKGTDSRGFATINIPMQPIC